MKCAIFIKKLSGAARLYHCSPPFDTHKFVIVSAITVLSLPETCIFPSNINGEVKEWLELRGSFKGEINHERALNNAGYEVKK